MGSKLKKDEKLSPLFVWMDNWRTQINMCFIELLTSRFDRLGVWMLKHSIYVTAYNTGYLISVTIYESIKKFLEI